MNPNRFQAITSGYSKLHLAVIGDFCLDRYFEIDPAKEEISIETGLPVHNIVKVRCQPGGAGTIVGNLAALGIGNIHVVGAAGEDGEGWELRKALGNLPGVRIEHFIQHPRWRTFTYTKPILVSPGQPPRELNRLDIKNWGGIPNALEQQLLGAVQALAGKVDGVIVLEQVDREGTGVITPSILKQLSLLARQKSTMTILGDSRLGLAHFPPWILK